MESPAMNFSRVIFLFLVVLGACFMVAGRIGTSGFCAVILTSAVAVAIIHNLDSLTRLGLKSGSAEATLEVTRQLRDEVFAKAVQVQRQAEQAAAISAWVVSITNRLVGESFQEQLLERRDELRAMLADLDVPPERQRTIVMPITKAVANDYRVQIRSEVQRAGVEAISGTEQQVDAIIQEVMAPLENSDRQTGLLELRRHAEQHNLQREGFHSAVDRYGRFLEQNQDIVKR